MTVLDQLAEQLTAIPPQALPASTAERLGIHLLDSVGAWIAGRATEEGAMLAGLKSESGAPLPLFSADPLDRLALACATIRLTEMDDIHMGSCTTPSSVVVPVALHFAATQRPSQPAPPARRGAFASALLAGYEVMTRFGAAIDGPHIVYRGLWPTYFAAPLGAAAAAARLLNLDPMQTADALGIALASASGAPGGPSAPSPRWLLLGLAARTGCAAALAAARGYSCDRKLLDGDWLQRTHGIAADPAPLVAPRKSDAALHALSIKPYCAAKQCIAAVEASRQLFGQGISPDEIARLLISAPPAYSAMIGHRRARDGRVARITSAPYNVALAACEPSELLDVARPDRTAIPRIAAFMERVEVVADEELSRHYPSRWPARAEATLLNGQTVSALILDAPGDPLLPFSLAGAIAKFHACADPHIGAAPAGELAAACLAAPESSEALASLCAFVLS